MFVDKKILASKKFKDCEYPSYIKDKIDTNNFKKPTNQEQMRKFWKSIERLIQKYSFRFSNQYNIDQEELTQQSFLFVVELLNKYQPAFHCDYIYSKVCNSRCPLWKKCRKQEFFGWQTYELKPYLFANIRLKMLDFSQQYYKKQKKLFDLDFSSDTSDNDSSDMVFSTIKNKKSMEGIVERKLLTEVLDVALVDVLSICKGTKKLVGELFFLESYSEKQIHEKIDKSQSTINTHISMLKKQVINHPKVQDLLISLKTNGVTIDDILGD